MGGALEIVMWYALLAFLAQVFLALLFLAAIVVCLWFVWTMLGGDKT